MTSDDVYKVHEQIGFPEISEKEQADLLIWHNVNIINDLTPNYKTNNIPARVAKKYIKLSKEKLENFLLKVDTLKRYMMHI